MTHKHDIVCLSESKVTFGSISSRFWSFLGLSLVEDNGIPLASLWILVLNNLLPGKVSLLSFFRSTGSLLRFSSLMTGI